MTATHADYFRQLLRQHDPVRTGRAGAEWVRRFRSQLVGFDASAMPLGVAVPDEFEPMRAVLAEECTAVLEVWARLASDEDRRWLQGAKGPAAARGPRLRFVFPVRVTRRGGVKVRDLDGVEPEDDGGLFEFVSHHFEWVEDASLALAWSSSSRSLTCEVNVEVSSEQSLTTVEVSRLANVLVQFWELASEKELRWIEPSQSEGRFDEPPRIVVLPEILRQEPIPAR